MTSVVETSHDRVHLEIAILKQTDFQLEIATALCSVPKILELLEFLHENILKYFRNLYVITKIPEVHQYSDNQYIGYENHRFQYRYQFINHIVSLHS